MLINKIVSTPVKEAAIYRFLVQFECKISISILRIGIQNILCILMTSSITRFQLSCNEDKIKKRKDETKQFYMNFYPKDAFYEWNSQQMMQ